MFNFIIIGSIPYNITCAASDDEYIYFGTEKGSIVKMNYLLEDTEKLTPDDIRSKVHIQCEVKIPKVDKRVEQMICFPSYYLLVILCNNTIYYADTRRLLKTKQTDYQMIIESPIKGVRSLIPFTPLIETVFIKRVSKFDSTKPNERPDESKIILDTEQEIYSVYDKRFKLTQFIEHDSTHLPSAMIEPSHVVVPKFGVLLDDDYVDFYQLVGVPTPLLKSKRYTEKYTQRRETPGPLELSEFRKATAARIEFRGDVEIDTQWVQWIGEFLIFVTREYETKGEGERSLKQSTYEFVRIPEQIEVKKKHEITRIVTQAETIMPFTNSPCIGFMPTSLSTLDKLKYYGDIKSRFEYMKGKDLEIHDNPTGWYIGMPRTLILKCNDEAILPYTFQQKMIKPGNGVIKLEDSTDVIAMRKDSVMYISKPHNEEGNKECHFISLTSSDAQKQDSCLPTVLMESVNPSFIYTNISTKVSKKTHTKDLSIQSPSAIKSEVTSKKPLEMRVAELSVPPNTPFGFVYDNVTKLILLIVKADVYQQISSILETTQALINKNRNNTANPLTPEERSYLITSIEECELAFSIALEKNWISPNSKETLSIRHKIGLKLYETQLFERFFTHMLTVFNEYDTLNSESSSDVSHTMCDNFLRSVFCHYSFSDFMKALDVNYKIPEYVPTYKWWEKNANSLTLASCSSSFYLPLELIDSININNVTTTFGTLYPVSEEFKQFELYFDFEPHPQRKEVLKQLLYCLFNTLPDPRNRNKDAGDNFLNKSYFDDDIFILYIFGLIVAGDNIDEYIKSLRLTDIRLILGSHFFDLAGKVTLFAEFSKSMNYFFLMNSDYESEESYVLGTNEESQRTSVAPMFAGIQQIMMRLAELTPTISVRKSLNITTRKMVGQNYAKSGNDDVLDSLIKFLPYISTAQALTNQIKDAYSKSGKKVSCKKEICMENLLEGPKAIQFKDRKSNGKPSVAYLVKGVRLGDLSSAIYALDPGYVMALFRGTMAKPVSGQMTKGELMELIRMVILTIKASLDGLIFKNARSGMERMLLNVVPSWNGEAGANLLMELLRVYYNMDGEVEKEDDELSSYKPVFDDAIKDIYIETRRAFQERLDITKIERAVVPKTEGLKMKDYVSAPSTKDYFSPFLPAFILFNLGFKNDFSICIEAILGEYVREKDVDLKLDDLEIQEVETAKSKMSMRPEDYIFTNLKQSRVYRTIKLPQTPYIRALGDYIYELIISLAVKEQRRKSALRAKVEANEYSSNIIARRVDDVVDRTHMKLAVGKGLTLKKAQNDVSFVNQYSVKQTLRRLTPFFKETHLSISEVDKRIPVCSVDKDTLDFGTAGCCGWMRICDVLNLLSAMTSEMKLLEQQEGMNFGLDYKVGQTNDLHSLLPVAILHSLVSQILHTDLATFQFVAGGDIPKLLRCISPDFPILALEDCLRVLGELQAAQGATASIRKNIISAMPLYAEIDKDQRKSSLYHVVDKSSRCAFCGKPFESIDSVVVLDGELIHIKCHDSITEL